MVKWSISRSPAEWCGTEPGRQESQTKAAEGHETANKAVTKKQEAAGAAIAINFNKRWGFFTKQVCYDEPQLCLFHIIL
ncbi:hypothetical protein HPB52_013812 [Rhipicephalus sanguineus]|uniref:Uncharacterized protein n=1 Tax=Rhipicephalus sanguineus TaxID=34632 RepID=A0A9D4T0S9_RHISA|nr:hypothetical protein HPB52_013812 [Rhipicephalus sanguineus]